MSSPPAVHIIGGGIAGLSAAYEISCGLPDLGLASADLGLTLHEASDRFGGKLRTSPFAGLSVDEGADAFITRVPHGLKLAQELGMSDKLVSPTGSTAYVWRSGGLKPFLKSQVLGVPLDIAELEKSGLVSAEGVEAARRDLARGDLARGDLARGGDSPPELAADATVGSVVRARLGDEIAETLVFPLVGSINAGNCDYLDVRTTAPLIAEAAQRSASLIHGLGSLRHERQSQARQEGSQPSDAPPVPSDPPPSDLPPSDPLPIFVAPEQGMEQLSNTLVDRLTALGVKLKLNCPVESVNPQTKTVSFGDQAALEPQTFDLAVLATPAWAAAQMLPSAAQPAAQPANQLASIQYCSVAIITVAFDRRDIPQLPAGNGFVVPARTSPDPTDQALSITACSWASSKWAHLYREGDSPAIFRVSLGRHQADDIVSASDQALRETVLADLAATLDIHAPPTELRISRWPRSFPQYAPGHQQLVDEAQAQLAPQGIFLAGAGYHGIGVPACIASGRRAGRQVLAALARIAAAK